MKWAGVYIALVAIGATVGSLQGCDDEAMSLTCGTGTHQMGTTCVADMTTAIMCGSNTALDDADNTCKLQTGACGPGTIFNAVTSTCELNMNHGTMIWSSTQDPDWSLVFYKVTDADAGDMYLPVGTEGGPTAGVPDSTLLFTADGTPMGGMPPIPASWGTGAADSTVLVANSKQITVGDWKKCKGTWSLYKNAPNSKAGDIRVVVQLQGCPANINFSVWHTFTTSDQYDDLIFGTPLGGVPSAFNTNADGTAYFERDLDPNGWFKAGVALGGASHGTGGVPDLTTYPNTHYSVDLVYHNTGQSNGNAGWCKPLGGGCEAAPYPEVLLPGQFGIDSFGLMTGTKVKGGGQTSTNPVPLGMLQP